MLLEAIISINTCMQNFMKQLHVHFIVEDDVQHFTIFFKKIYISHKLTCENAVTIGIFIYEKT